jgi:hypothetical protein
LFGGFESDGVGVEHGEFDFLLRLLLPLSFRERCVTRTR